ncbi:hypothetical protein MMC15_004049 [Xylographa vitiligo]|nr:hypothetical protein [Xylographa vitiligo]
MSSRLVLRVLFTCFFLAFAAPVFSATSTAPAASPIASVGSSTASHTSTPSGSSTAPTTTAAPLTPTPTTPAPSPAASTSTPPDVLLNVPNLSVGRIELDVDNLQADINLNANVASLVTINAGVALSVQNINLTIVDVQAQLELTVRLGHLVDIVNRVFQSLDLNPLLLSTVGNVTSALAPVVVGAVDGLLGSVLQGGATLSFLVDNLGNIVQQVVGPAGASPVSSIVGNYLANMTFTGASQSLQGGLTQKTYAYAPLNALVDIVFNAAGQVVQATLAGQSSGGGGTASGGSGTATVPPSGTATLPPSGPPTVKPTGSSSSSSSSASAK